MAEREARRFVEFVHARLRSGGDILISKPRSKAIGRACGVRVPEDYAAFADIASIDFGDRPPPFVLKPTHLTSKQGVFILTRRDGDRYYDAFSKTWLTIDSIKIAAAATADRHFNPDSRYILEEFVPGANPEPIPYDYKMYTFGDDVLFVLQVNRNVSPPAMAFFGKDMVPLTLGRELYSADPVVDFGEPVVPPNWPAMLDVARRVSSHMRTPFISVDVYTTGADVILGEATTTPGGPYFGTMFRFLPEFDLHLGDAWRRAGERLGMPVPMIADDPPCFEKEEELFSGRLERSLRAENTSLRDQLRAASAEVARLADNAAATRAMFKRLTKKTAKLHGLLKKRGRRRKARNDSPRRKRRGRQDG
ncbi:MAG: hypothetical protein KDK07_16775 [Bauldia sp.]|nr:hypothetical protein [Bauldia sp.]